MAAPAELGDFFAKNKKKKVKGSNLNNTSAATKTEEKKTKTNKDKDDDEWQEEHVETAEMKVAVAGKLTRDEEKKEDDDATAPAWGSIKNKGGSDTHQNLSDKRFPTLAKSVQSSNINLDDGSEGKINIKTTKNAFAALENQDDDDEELPKRPKEIKPAMVQKKKGEAEKAAIEREVDKYGGKKGEKADKGEDTEKRKAEKKKKDKKKKEEEDDEEEEADDDDEAQEDEDDGRKKKDKKKKDSKAAGMKAEEDFEDMKIVPDLEATKRKYDGRCKLPRKDLPDSEMEEKENRVSQNRVQASSKKKKVALEEEDYDKPKLQFVPDM